MSDSGEFIGPKLPRDMVVDHADFIMAQREERGRLLGEGYGFAGNLRPPKYAGKSYDDQEASLRERFGDVEYGFIGDCSEATRPRVEGTSLEYTDGWIAVYVRDTRAEAGEQ